MNFLLANYLEVKHYRLVKIISEPNVLVDEKNN